MRRGFKTEAREIATEMRDELRLASVDPLDPWNLADHLDIPVWTLSSYRSAIPDSAGHLLAQDPKAFSAMLAFAGLRRVIIHNDEHALTRQRADICHELGHALLLHRPHPSAGTGRLQFDSEQEDEAHWLGAVLLVPDEFCLACAKRSLPLADAAAQMGVSGQLMRWRFNMSGASRRVSRAQAASR